MPLLIVGSMVDRVSFEQSHNRTRLRFQLLRRTPLCHGPENPVLNPVNRSLTRDQSMYVDSHISFYKNGFPRFHSEITSFWIRTQTPPSWQSNAITETFWQLIYKYMYKSKRVIGSTPLKISFEQFALDFCLQDPSGSNLDPDTELEHYSSSYDPLTSQTCV